MMTNENRKDERFSELLSTIEKRKVLPDKQFLAQLREKSAKEFETCSVESKEHLQTKTISIWRIIMRTKTTKFAAAAVIIIAALIGINSFLGTGTSVVWGEVIEKTEQIPTVIYEMTSVISYPGANNEMSTKSDVYDGGAQGNRIDMYMNGELGMQKFLLPEQGIGYFVRHRQKQYTRFELTGELATMKEDFPRQWIKVILSESYAELGSGNINGIDVEGIEVHNSKLLGGAEGIVRLWVDVKTNLPVRFELEGMMMEGDVKRPTKHVIDDFQWDVEIDASVFNPEIPGDFVQVEQQKQAPIKELSSSEKDEQASAKETVTALFRAIANENWGEVSNIWPGLVLDERRKTRIKSVEILSIEEPFKRNDSSDWIVPYYIKVPSGEIDDKTLRVRYDETAMRFIVCGGS